MKYRLFVYQELISLQHRVKTLEGEKAQLIREVFQANSRLYVRTASPNDTFDTTLIWILRCAVNTGRCWAGSRFPAINNGTGVVCADLVRKPITKQSLLKVLLKSYKFAQTACSKHVKCSTKVLLLMGDDFAAKLQFVPNLRILDLVQIPGPPCVSTK